MSNLKLGVDAQLTSNSISKIQKELDKLKNLDIKVKSVDSSEISKSLKDTIHDATKSITTSISGTALSELKKSFSDLKEIDTYLTKIKNSNTMLSKSDLEQIGSLSFEAADKYGKAASIYLSSVQKAFDSGYKNATDIAELSLAAQNAGNLTSDLSDRYITAMDRAFKMNGSVKELSETLDGANNITNSNSVNMTELAEGLSIVSSHAAAAKMNAAETTAVIGTLISTTQNSGSEMGNAFIDILSNLQKMTGNIGDGQPLMEPMQILKELSDQYTKLDESNPLRTDLLNSVGGSYGSEALNAILENYGLYEKMLQDYANGGGTVAAEAENTANSWEGAMNRLNNTWTSTIGNIADSEAVTMIADSFNNILSIINNLTNSLGSLGTIGVAAGLFAGFKNVGRDKMYSLMF